MEQHHRSALLVMDMQLSILSRITETEPLLTNVASAIAAARSRNMPVIYVVVGFRAEAPEISMNNKSFSAFGNKDMWTPEFSENFVKIHPAIAPQPGDVTVTKRRVSAFTGSDLEVVLRAKNVNHLVFTGIATSGVVLSTLREAADKDYKMTVIEDSCGDMDAEVHQVLTTKIFPRQADVVTTAEWCK